MSDHVYVTAPALAGSGLETPAALGVPFFAGLSLRPAPRAVALHARAAFGSASELLDVASAASRLAAHLADVTAELQQRLDALAADLPAARRLVDDAQKLARKPDDLAVGTIAAHRQLVAGMLARHETPLPAAVDRARRLAGMDQVTAPLVHEVPVRQVLADIDRLADAIAGEQAGLEACADRLATLHESATTARAGTIADLQTRLAAAEARASGDDQMAALNAVIAKLYELAGRPGTPQAVKGGA